jgi:hypothetical protein
MKHPNDSRTLTCLTLLSILWGAIALLGYFEVLASIQKLVAEGQSLTSFGPIVASMNLVGFSIFVCFALICCAAAYYLYLMFTHQEAFDNTLTEMNTRMQDQQQILRQLLRAYYTEKPLSLTGKPPAFPQEIKESEEF